MNAPRWPSRLPALLLLVSLLSIKDSNGLARSILETAPSTAGSCKNTRQGINLVADDKGKVCNRQEVDYSTGCCSAGLQFACDRCDPNDNCCTEFENCVSCCLAPQHKPQERMKQAPKIRERLDLGHWDNPFSFCMAACRTHRRSTVHENAYLGSAHHCFSPLGKPLLTGPAPKVLSTANATLLLSNAGESCAAACQRSSLHCAPALLPPLNNCDRLREHFPCEAGCGPFTNQPFHPAYVDPSAPKNMRPAICMVTGSQPALACDSHEQHIRRLCPCSAEQLRPAAGGSGAKPAHLRGAQPGSKPAGAPEGT